MYLVRYEVEEADYTMLLVDRDGRVCNWRYAQDSWWTTTTRTSWLFGVDGMKLLLALLFRMIEHYCRDLAARFS